MLKNMTIARIIRIIIGLWLIGAGIYAQSFIWIAGLFPLYSGIANKCPSFWPGSNSSCSIETKENKNS